MRVSISFQLNDKNGFVVLMDRLKNRAEFLKNSINPIHFKKIRTLRARSALDNTSWTKHYSECVDKLDRKPLG